MKKFLLVLALVPALQLAVAQQVTPQPECVSGSATSTSADAAQTWITRLETGVFADWFIWRTGNSCFAFSPEPVTAFRGDELGETQFRNGVLHYSCRWSNGVQVDIDGNAIDQFGSFPLIRYVSRDVYTVCD